MTTIGGRIRYFRRLAGVTQEQIADRVGISFQQFQKYENGKNRIGSGRLMQVAKFLRVPIEHFFQGFSTLQGADDSHDADRQRLVAFALTNEGMRLVRRYLDAPTPRHRRLALEILTLQGKATNSEP